MSETILTFPILSIGAASEDPNGSAFGDFSVDIETSTRCTWLAPRTMPPYVTLTVTYFVTSWLLDDQGNKLRQLEHGEEVEDGANVVFACGQQQEWIAHSDQHDPGGSEVASDIEYDLDLLQSWVSLEDARELVRAWAPDEAWHLWQPENWTGRRT